MALSMIKWALNLKTIGEHAFRRCTSLEEADMSKLHALETIGYRIMLFQVAVLLLICLFVISVPGLQRGTNREAEPLPAVNSRLLG